MQASPISSPPPLVTVVKDVVSQLPAPAAVPAACMFACCNGLFSLWNVSHNKLLPYVTFGQALITGKLTNTRGCITGPYVTETETGFLWEKIWVEKNKMLPDGQTYLTVKQKL